MHQFTYLVFVCTCSAICMITKLNYVVWSLTLFMQNTVTNLADYKGVASTNGLTAATTSFTDKSIYHFSTYMTLFSPHLKEFPHPLRN